MLFLIFVGLLKSEQMIVHQLSHLLTIRMIFHLDHVADYADRIGFELVHVFVIIHKKSCITRTKRFYELVREFMG